MGNGDYVELFKDRAGKWRWRHKTRNGMVVDTPGESFYSKWNAKRSAKRVHPGVELRVLR